jgi:hypothetical protein
MTRNRRTYDVAIVKAAVGKVKTLPLVCPSYTFVPSVRELLVSIPVNACIDLHLVSVLGTAVGDVEALVVVDVE